MFNFKQRNKLTLFLMLLSFNCFSQVQSGDEILASDINSANNKIDNFQAIFTNQQLSQNGYQVFPNGLTIQWGRSSGGSYGTNVTFPIPFTVVFNVTATVNSGGNSMTGVTNVSPTGFRGYIDRHDALNETKAFYWMAIGLTTLPTP